MKNDELIALRVAVVAIAAAILEAGDRAAYSVDTSGSFDGDAELLWPYTSRRIEPPRYYVTRGRLLLEAAWDNASLPSAQFLPPPNPTDRR